MKHITIIQGVAPQYRLPFYVLLYQLLKQHDVHLKVVYSDPIGAEATKGDTVTLPDEFGIHIRGFWMFENRLLIQPIFREIIEADLVICEQASKHFAIYPLVVLSALGLKTFAFWGHGAQFAEQKAVGRCIKNTLLDKSDWWFAYTKKAAEYLIAQGVPPDTVIVVQNSIDTVSLRNAITRIADDTVTTERQRLGIPSEARVGLYIGHLGRAKEPDFLINCAFEIRKRVPEFHWLVAGSGTERKRIEELASGYNWVHYLGPVFEDSKALACRLAEVFLVPSSVGLAILDAFAAGRPIVTSEHPYHGPEIEYLKAGCNGIMSPHDPAAYANAVADLFRDRKRFDHLCRGSEESAGTYTIEAMAQNFKNGVLKALAK